MIQQLNQEDVIHLRSGGSLILINLVEYRVLFVKLQLFTLNLNVQECEEHSLELYH